MSSLVSRSSVINRPNGHKANPLQGLMVSIFLVPVVAKSIKMGFRLNLLPKFRTPPLPATTTTMNTRTKMKMRMRKGEKRKICFGRNPRRNMTPRMKLK